jgi:hypothetical protein
VLAALPAADNGGHCAARHANAMPSMDVGTSSQSHAGHGYVYHAPMICMGYGSHQSTFLTVLMVRGLGEYHNIDVSTSAVTGAWEQ